MDSLEGAEFSKLLDNSFRDHMFSFSNQFIEFAEKSYLNLKTFNNSF
jgi:UDP-N-acetyl-D-mannosaminuronate dehydrogenase